MDASHPLIQEVGRVELDPRGPESVPATTPEHWRPIIRRCVLYDRRALLAGLEPLLRSPGNPVPEPGEALRGWHEAAHRRFLGAAEADREGDRLKRAHYQLSYRIDVVGGEQWSSVRRFVWRLSTRV